MPNSLRRQAKQLFRVFADLVRAYQFRDREGICCHGLSVSQCYTLDTLHEQGPLTMSQLAGRLFLDTSTMTRVVDQLVRDKLATRITDAGDRRVCRVRTSAKGRSLLSKIRAELIKEHECVLQEIPAENREAVITAMSRLLAAFMERQRNSCAEAEVCSTAKRRVG
jgi:DNA-binding MarR family transcriptional regulator